MWTDIKIWSRSGLDPGFSTSHRMSEVRPYCKPSGKKVRDTQPLQKFFLTGNYVTKTEEEFFDDFTKITNWAKSEQCEFLYIWEEYGTETGNHHYHAIVQVPRS